MTDLTGEAASSAGTSRVPLVLELVPRTSWGDNLRSMLTKDQWGICKTKTSVSAGFRCEVCGGHGGQQGRAHRVECHEVWEYETIEGCDPRTCPGHEQILLRLIALCPRCHGAKHIGFSATLGEEYLARIIDHLMQVNQWDESEVEGKIKEAFALWEKRSEHQWSVNVSVLRGPNGLGLLS